MLIRKMTKADIPFVLDIEKQSFSMPWSKKGFEDAFRNTDNILLVAELDGRICGYACTYVFYEEGELTNIAVSPEARGQGIAGAILKVLKDMALAQEVKSIVLEVRVSNSSARHLYESMGFVELGIRKNFYEQPVEDAVIMSCAVEDN